jgi:hypothetical protein
VTAALLDAANSTLRDAVAARRAATDPNDPKLVGYKIDNGDPEPGEVPGWTRLRGDSLMQSDVHPTSQAFFDLCDALKEMHRRKSRDYGCPSGEDPLANIRNGARFVGIPSWKGAMVRLSDKVTRLAAYNATGRLENESLEDNLFDLASYSLLALLLHREERGE